MQQRLIQYATRYAEKWFAAIRKFTLGAKQRKWLSVFVAVVVLYALAGFLLFPAVLRYKLPDMIRAATGRDSSIAAVTFHPFQLAAQLQGFELKEKNGQTFVKFAEFYADLNVWRSIRQRALSFAEIRLAEPFVQINRQKNGVFNYADLISASEPEAEESGLLPFEVVKLRLLDGGVNWRDELYAVPVSESVHAVNLEINDLIARGDAQAAVNISLALKSGTKLQWDGKFGLLPLHSEGRIHIRELQTRQIWEAFLQDNKAVVFNKGVNEIDTGYRLDYNGGQLNISLSPLLVAVNGFVMSESGKPDPFIDVQTLKLHDARLDVNWTEASGQWRIKIPQGLLEINNFAMSDPGEQKQHFEIGDFALQGLKLELLYKDTLQLNVEHQKIEIKDSTFALNNERPLKVDASAIALGPVQFSATQQKPGSALALKATQNSFKVQKLAVSLPATRETILDVAEVAIGKVQFALQPKEDAAPQIQVLQDTFEAKQVILRESGQPKPLAVVESAAVSDTQFDMDKKLVQIGTAKSTGADIDAWLNSDGTLNYQALIAGKKPETNAAVPENAKPVLQPSAISSAGVLHDAEMQWTVAVNKLELENGAVSFQDRSRKPPASFKLAAINAGLENLNSAGSDKFPLRFSAAFNDSATIKLSGNARLQPFNAELDIDVAKFPLKPFQTYFNQFVLLDVLGGTLHIGGKAALDMSKPEQPQVSFRGSTGINQFHSRDQRRHRDFAKWERLALQGVAFDLQPLSFNVKEILVEEPYLRVVVGKQKTVNLGQILVQPAQSQAASQAKTPVVNAKKSPAMAFNVKKVKLRRGHMDFSDYSLLIPFVANIDHLDGMLADFSSHPDSEASLELQGKILDLAPVDITGAFKPHQGESKIALSFRNMPLPAATPYMAEFAGYKIEKGQMDLDLKYTIAKGQLTASNKIRLDQLTLGDKVESPRAVSLPLSLAVTLLKDTQGKINIDFPISGSLEDPKFSIGSLIGDALMNVVTKVATSPFRAIAALVGSEDEDMGRIDFDPGKAELSPAEIEKLDGLAKVFAERKTLNLEIKGNAYQQQDWPELTGGVLREQLQRMRIEELRKDGESPQENDIALSEKEYQRLLADLFISKYPQLAKRSLFGTPKLVGDDKSDFYAVAERKLRDDMEPNPRKLRNLAANRAQVIAKYLLQQKGIDGSRIFILDTNVEPQAPKQGIAVTLSLRGS